MRMSARTPAAHTRSGMRVSVAAGGGSGKGAGGCPIGSVTHSPESQLFELRTGRGGPTTPIGHPPAPLPLPPPPVNAPAHIQNRRPLRLPLARIDLVSRCHLSRAKSEQ